MATRRLQMDRKNRDLWRSLSAVGSSVLAALASLSGAKTAQDDSAKVPAIGPAGCQSDGARADGARADGARADGARTDGARTDWGQSDPDLSESNSVEVARAGVRSPLVVWREWVAVCGVTGLVLVLWLVRWLWMADSLLDVDSTSERARVGRLDLNRATEGELVRLPGVGGGLAARIVQHRVQAGNFRTLEQLTEVAGIGPQRLQQFRAYCFVAGEVESSDRKVVPENRRTVSVAGTVSTRR